MNLNRSNLLSAARKLLRDSLGRSLPILSMAIASSAWSQWETPERIAAEALAFARSHTADLPGKVDVGIGKFDHTVRVPRCNRLDAYLPPNARLWGKSIVGVRCQDPLDWSLQIPVMVRVTAPVVITARPVARRQVLSEADLTQRTMEVSQLPLGLITDMDQALGHRTVAALAAGTALRGDMLKSAPVITQGQTVKLLYKGDSFHISGEARALADASLGEQVAVRAASGKVLRGIAVEKGVVQVQ